MGFEGGIPSAVLPRNKANATHVPASTKTLKLPGIGRRLERKDAHPDVPELTRPNLTISRLDGAIIPALKFERPFHLGHPGRLGMTPAHLDNSSRLQVWIPLTLRSVALSESRGEIPRRRRCRETWRVTGGNFDAAPLVVAISNGDSRRAGDVQLFLNEMRNIVQLFGRMASIKAGVGRVRSTLLGHHGPARPGHTATSACI